MSIDQMMQRRKNGRHLIDDLPWLNIFERQCNARQRKPYTPQLRMRYVDKSIAETWFLKVDLILSTSYDTCPWRPVSTTLPHQNLKVY